MGGRANPRSPASARCGPTPGATTNGCSTPRKVFADHGGNASMEAIAKQAGVGVGNLYRHFPKRIDVVEAVYRDDVDVLIAAADRGLGELDPWEALEAWLRAFVEHGWSKRTLLSELHEAFEKNPDLKSLSHERISAACDRVLARAQEAGQASLDVDGTDLVQLVSPVCVSPTLAAVQGERLLGMILDGLRPPRGQGPAGPPAPSL